jgi:hypothetical protein
MSLIKLIARLLLLAGLMLVGRTAIAGPLHCAYGNQDSTCVPTISAAWQAPPTCSSAPGWTTVAVATWIGSQYSAPQCNYQARPSCPSGYNETESPSWNGSGWVGLGCTPIITPPPDPMTACESSVPGGFSLTNFLNSNAHNSQYPSDTGLEFGGTGPEYSTECSSSNTYFVFCFVSQSGSVDTWQESVGEGSQGNCGGH